ncbi:hypothetical protein D1816_04760 [Aquimarina sp. AD10]|uniref:Uncharacterized protein n=1 Tax=Aquimarina aggregata TaxID=1642818 RepID=A0A162CX13_9FLAO|nr:MULTISPECIES: hypothetical protein [Aquimarina]AXT59695.1 hypothetical protein D1816_04760 [Aquimarina sp. AD10]KZS42319.1 hypothetical protein AWE51_02445 [Aquimarina aggregata]RKM97571.1 hypothetical protein D7033_14340 [Aquimarina sp. AD10]
MKQPKEILKTYFETGDKPTEQQFCDLIDSYHHLDSGTIVTSVVSDAQGNQNLNFSDGTVVTITKPTDHISQNNKIRIVDLGTITAAELSIEASLVNAVNRLNPPLVVADDENIIFEFDVRRFGEGDGEGDGPIFT